MPPVKTGRGMPCRLDVERMLGAVMEARLAVQVIDTQAALGERRPGPVEAVVVGALAEVGIPGVAAASVLDLEGQRGAVDVQPEGGVLRYQVVGLRDLARRGQDDGRRGGGDVQRRPGVLRLQAAGLRDGGRPGPDLASAGQGRAALAAEGLLSCSA
jgi:hypothetical protein